MTTDKTPATLATVKHGGCVRLGDGHSLAEHITDHLCANDYGIGGRPELLVCVVEAIASDTRARFEAWARLNGHTLTRSADGEYCFISVRNLWTSWQAALSAQPSPFETLPPEMRSSSPDYLDYLDARPSPGGQDALASLPLYRLADDANGNRGLHRDDTGSWVKLQDVERALAARQPVGELNLPPDGYYKIVYDDAQVPDESFARTGGLDAALRRFEQISERWNAHLFVRFANNTRDCTVPNATPAQAVDLPYSLDADPAGIRARVADVITGTLMVGAQGHTPPPAGHWAEPFWHAARADAGLQVKMREALWAAARSLRTIADSTKETEFLETAGEIRAYAGSRANCAEQILTDSRGAKLG